MCVIEVTTILYLCILRGTRKVFLGKEKAIDCSTSLMDLLALLVGLVDPWKLFSKLLQIRCLGLVVYRGNISVL